MKEMIETELLRRGYTIITWFKMFDSWVIKVAKNDKSVIVIDANLIMDELLEKEMCCEKDLTFSQRRTIL